MRKIFQNMSMFGTSPSISSLLKKDETFPLEHTNKQQQRRLVVEGSHPHWPWILEWQCLMDLMRNNNKVNSDRTPGIRCKLIFFFYFHVYPDSNWMANSKSNHRYGGKTKNLSLQQILLASSSWFLQSLSNFFYPELWCIRRLFTVIADLKQ